MIILKGSTRWTFLVGRYAIKIPSCHSYKNFLWGLLGNIQEKSLSTLKSKKLCPVLFSIPGGFLSIYPKALRLSDDQFNSIDFEEWTENKEEGFKIPIENKICSFGILNGNIVAVDYGD